MAEVLLKPPGEDEIEVSLFGPGYGECIVIHTGHGDWVINDSCVIPSKIGQRDRPVALAYLEDLGVTVSESVSLVVASHWHDDHIRGLAEIVGDCQSATFVCSAALNGREFLQLVSNAEKAATSLGSGVSEFKKIVELARDGRANIKFAMADQLLWRGTSSPAQAHSLSPSSATLTSSFVDIADLVEDVRERRIRVPSCNPNASSVVIWIDIGDGSQILLGGDLETHTDARHGWKAIVGSNTRPRGRASIYKVAHHGSKNAHLDEIWSELLHQDGISILTPWRRGAGFLPTDRDIERISSLSKETYVTTRAGSERPARRSRLAMEEVRRATRSWSRLEPSLGHIQLRKTFGQDNWRVGFTPDAAEY